MKNVYLLRTSTSDMGTEGVLITNGFMCKMIELPWRENQHNISCIPSGEYLVKIRKSPKYGKIYWVTNVPNRSFVLIHTGNYAGDESKRYRSDSWGCLLIGQKFGWLNKQRVVLNSRITLRRFMNHMNYESFKLHIIGNF